MRVVIFKFNHLGDNVVFLPVVQQLRRQFSDWDLVLLTTPTEAELYRGPDAPKRSSRPPNARSIPATDVRGACCGGSGGSDG